MLVDLAERLVAFDVPTVWRPPNDAGLDPMLENCPIGPLQT